MKLNAKALMDEAREAGLTGRGMFALIGARLGIDYYEDRESEKVLKTRHEGKWVPSESGGEVWDSGKDWGRAGWPDSFNNIEEALAEVGQVKALWYHIPSMNLVLFDGEHKVGIRSTDFRIFGLGFRPERVQALMDGLAAKMRNDAS